MIQSLPTANRGEIACRIIRTARAALPRHAELVSASMPRRAPVADIEAWTLKQVQHDEGGDCRA
jgi:hypothetical protein